MLPVDLTSTLEDFQAAYTAVLAAESALEQALESKLAAMEMLVSNMKCDIRYAENQSGGADDQLRLIGWGGKKAPTPLVVPGQPKYLAIVSQGEGAVELGWKKPDEGGAVAAYRVQRRERPAGAWQDVAMAVVTTASLTEQPRGKEYEYRVIGVNKAGEGEPSNIQMAVL